MKQLILVSFILIASAISTKAQCANQACENLPATIELDVSVPPLGQALTYNWTVAVPFTGQSTDVIQITNVGLSPAIIAYSVTVTNIVTGCVTDYNCTIVVNDAVPVSVTIPPYCLGAGPFDVSAYINPAGSTLSGPGINGTVYDPTIGGPVTATPPLGSGCLIASTQTPISNPGPIINSVSVTQ